MDRRFLPGPFELLPRDRAPAVEGIDDAHLVGLDGRDQDAVAELRSEADGDEPGYYAFFAFDPDGIRVEVFSWTSAQG